MDLKALRTLPLILAAASVGHAEEVAPLVVQFFPATEIHSHQVEPRRGLATLLLQNAAVINRGTEPVRLTSVRLELYSGDRLVQSQPLEGEALAAIAARSGALAMSGQLELLSFHFRPATLLGGARAVGTLELGPSEALVLGHRAFLAQGSVDRLTLVARAERAGSSGSLHGEGSLVVVATPRHRAVGFPLSGRWFVAAGASWHTHHRWVVSEEFALDLGRLGDGGSTHRGEGRANEDYYAWDAEVHAVADGTVVAVVDRYPDIAPLVRQRGESAEAYLGRVQAAQASLLATGFEAIAGNLVVVDHGGSFSHYAHLRSGSVVVEPGQRVRRGTVLARLGNSGNTTEPHLHFQLADSADPLHAVGLPVEFDDIEILWAESARPLQSGDIVEVK